MNKYKITFGSGLIWCYVEYEKGDYESEAVDNLIDRLELEGHANIYTLDEVDEMGYEDDLYFIGGNRGLCLVHYGTFEMEVMG